MEAVMMFPRFYVVDTTGCGYADDIIITNNSKRKAAVLIDTVDDFARAKMVAAKYLYDTQYQIDKASGEDMSSYPEFEYNELEYDFTLELSF